MASVVVAWPTVALNEVLTERIEAPSPDALARGEIPIVAKVSFDDGNIHLRAGRDTKTGMILVRPGDLLVSGINAAKGAIAIYDASNTGPIAATIHYGAYVIDTTCADVKFLWWLLRSGYFRTILAEYVPGGIKTELKASRLLKVPVPLPPLDEQRRIVACIEALAARIAEARGLRQAAMAEAEALLDAARVSVFESALRAGSRQLHEIALLERGKFSYRPRNEPRFFGGAHPWIQIAEIEASGKYIRQWSQTLNDDGLAVSRKFPRGTLLISIAATIGAVGILDFDCCVPDSIVGITPKAGNDSIFLYHYLEYLRGHLELLAPQSAQKNINLGILAPLPVPALELDAQRQIADYLDDVQCQVDNLWQDQQRSAEALNALLPSLLDKAFRGEL